MQKLAKDLLGTVIKEVNLTKGVKAIIDDKALTEGNALVKAIAEKTDDKEMVKEMVDAIQKSYFRQAMKQFRDAPKDIIELDNGIKLALRKDHSKFGLGKRLVQRFNYAWNKFIKWLTGRVKLFKVKTNEPADKFIKKTDDIDPSKASGKPTGVNSIAELKDTISKKTTLIKEANEKLTKAIPEFKKELEALNNKIKEAEIPFMSKTGLDKSIERMLIPGDTAAQSKAFIAHGESYFNLVEQKQQAFKKLKPEFDKVKAKFEQEIVANYKIIDDELQSLNELTEYENLKKLEGFKHSKSIDEDLDLQGVYIKLDNQYGKLGRNFSESYHKELLKDFDHFMSKSFHKPHKPIHEQFYLKSAEELTLTELFNTGRIRGKAKEILNEKAFVDELNKLKGLENHQVNTKPVKIKHGNKTLTVYSVDSLEPSQGYLQRTMAIFDESGNRVGTKAYYERQYKSKIGDNLPNTKGQFVEIMPNTLTRNPSEIKAFNDYLMKRYSGEGDVILLENRYLNKESAPFLKALYDNGWGYLGQTSHSLERIRLGNHVLNEGIPSDYPYLEKQLKELQQELLEPRWDRNMFLKSDNAPKGKGMPKIELMKPEELDLINRREAFKQIDSRANNELNKGDVHSNYNKLSGELQTNNIGHVSNTIGDTSLDDTLSKAYGGLKPQVITIDKAGQGIEYSKLLVFNAPNQTGGFDALKVVIHKLDDGTVTIKPNTPLNAQKLNELQNLGKHLSPTGRTKIDFNTASTRTGESSTHDYWEMLPTLFDKGSKFKLINNAEALGISDDLLSKLIKRYSENKRPDESLKDFIAAQADTLLKEDKGYEKVIERAKEKYDKSVTLQIESK